MKQKFLVFTIVAWFLCCAALAQDVATLKQKAEGGDVSSMMQLASAYENGTSVRADRFQAFDWYMKAAEVGNAEAQNTVAVMLRTGDGGRKDPEEAVKWYRKSAKQGFADAMFNLGTAYYNGDGVSVSDQSALAWFIVAQAFGSKQAEEAVKRSISDVKAITQAAGMLKAAQMMIDGAEVPVRSEASVIWLNKLAASGRKIANVYLADLYLQGKGVPKNLDLAARYCEEGAADKVPQAMRCLGYMYRTGTGKPADATTAASWYLKAAKCGEGISMYQLSEMYATGEGVKKDRVQQYMLLEEASRRSVELAKRKLEELKPQLSAKELKSAEKKRIELDTRCNFDAALQ